MLFVAIIWGLAFVAQSDGMNYIGPFTFNFIRNLLATSALLVFLLIRKIIRKSTGVEPVKEDKKTLWVGGILTGTCLFIASSFQQYGLVYTEPSKAGFINSLYMVFVPIIGLLFHKKTGINVWLSVLLAIVGFYFLCIKEGLSIDIGEVLVFISAIFFALQIIVIDLFTHNVDGVKMSCIQFGTVVVLSTIPLIMEKPNMDNIFATMPSLLYVGLISGCLGFTIQIIGQKDVSATVSSLILSLEAVFSLVFSAIILKEMFDNREMLGAILIFSAVILSQLPFSIFKKKYKNS